jgi:hypothetical protein
MHKVSTANTSRKPCIVYIELVFSNTALKPTIRRSPIRGTIVRPHVRCSVRQHQR